VYVFSSSDQSGGWSEIMQITLSNGQQSDLFGSSISVSADGTTAFFAAEGRTTDASHGMVVVFSLDIEQRTFALLQWFATDLPNTYFGGSVVVSNTALRAAVTCTEAGDNSTSRTFVYSRSEVTSPFTLAIVFNHTGDNSTFVSSMQAAMSSDGAEIVVGAHTSGPSHCGLVYMYWFQAGEWQWWSTIQPQNSTYASEFGRSLALSADGLTLFVGASSAVLPGGNISGGTITGFSRMGNIWVPFYNIWAVDANIGGSFGASVAMTSDAKLVSSLGWSSTPNQGASTYIAVL
jgi:hypothetical protein